MLEVGNIYVLKLSHKIEKHGLLIFDISENITARLHIGNLSNNQTLNQKMFDLFDVGQEVVALTKNFNEKKNYYELSTKAFRNSLDDILSFKKCSKIVNERFRFYNEIHVDHLIQYRKILDRLRGDLASTGLTFLYELLQNAVDHPNKNFNNELSVHFEIFNNYLLLKHNGALFTENNFKAICGILYGEQQNETESNRIGYKGIGFKSVYRHTNNVYVRSGNFSFSFNREIIGENKPWEVIPIFQNEIDKIDEIPQFDFFNSPVAFAFEFISESHKKNVIAHLNELSQNPYLLIFLDRLRSLKITTPLNEHVFEKEIISVNPGYDTIELKVNDSLFSKWSLFSNSFVIDDQNIIGELLDESNKSIPDHFRQFRSPKIDVIVPEEHIENPINLFTYLPLTATKFQLEYIVNADFIPNLDRSNIIESLSYNFKLTEFIGIQIINVCKSFASNKEFKKIKQLFPIYETGAYEFKDKLQSSFIDNVKDSEIFPSYYDDKLYPLNQTLYDYTGLYEIIPETLYNQFTNTEGNPLDLDSGLGDEYLYLNEKLSIGHLFKKEDLVTSLTTEEFIEWLKNPENSFLIISHLHSKEDLKDLLKTENVILSSLNELKNSASIYKSVPKELSFFKLSEINPELLNLLDENEISVKLLEFDPVKFYKENILGKESAFNTYLTSKEKLLDFWKFIYNNWQHIEQEKAIVDSLKTVLILCKPIKDVLLSTNNISSAYLSVEFDRESNIEEVIKSIGVSDVSFISEKYISEEYKAEKWKKIFKKTDSVMDLQRVIDALIPKLTSIDDPKHFEIGKQIFKYWKDNKGKETKLSEKQLLSIKNNLKIKCFDGSFMAIGDCIISDHYTTNPVIDTFLPEIILTNQITDEYERRGNYVVEWNNFFKLIGCQSIHEKQAVLDSKLEYFLTNQDSHGDSHFLILKAISNLYRERQNNNLSFEFEGELSKLKLKANDGQWYFPDKIHFSSLYNPKLDLQSDESINSSYLFLNDEYWSRNIEKPFISALGVNNSFSFKTALLKREEIPNDYLQLFQKKHSYIAQNAISYGSQHRLHNHVVLNYLELLSIVEYSDIFWNDVARPNSRYLKFLFQKSTYKTAWNSYLLENDVINHIKTNRSFPNQVNEMKKPGELFSYKLAAFINDNSDLPKYDLSEIVDENQTTTSLEDLLGFHNQLSEEHCIQLLGRGEENGVSYQDLIDLNIVEILQDYQPKVEEKGNLFLLNKDLEWKPLSELFVSSDGKLELMSHQQLHDDFYPLADNFGIPKLSEDTLVIKFSPETPNLTNEIKTVFKSKAKYIAFKTDRTDYEEIESELVEHIDPLDFYEIDSMEKVFPEFNPIYRTEIDFHYYINEKKIYYKGYWKTNPKIIDFLFGLVDQEGIERIWFENVINHWSDDKITDILEGEYGETPWNNGDKNNEERKNTTFLDEVTAFIAELEETEWNEYIPELKNILELSVSHPKEKQKLFNLIAKLKLAKERNIHFDKADKDYNHLEKDGEKYFVHSARGAFAYIHPNEILQMKRDGYKMALDFSTNSRIKIYKTAEEILQLNTNHILAYQYEKTMEDLFSFCEANRDANKHLLIIDKNNSGEKSKALLKLLNIDGDDYQ